MPAIIVASLALLSGASALRVPPKLPERAPPPSAQKHAAVVTAAVLAIGAAQPPDAAFAAFGLPLLGTAPAATTAAANAAATAEAAAAAATAANAATSTSDFDAAEAWSKLSAFARDTASVAKQAAGAAKDAYEDERTQAALKVAGKVAGTTLDVAGEGFKLATSAAERDRVATEVNALPGKAASSVAKGLGETASVAASALGDVASVAVDAVTSTPVVKQQLDDFARAQAETDALIARNARAVLNDPLVSQALSTSRAVLNDPATQAALTTTQEALTTGAIATGSALSDSLTAFSEAVTTEGGLSKLIDAKYTEISKAIATETPKLAESLKDSGMSAAEVAAKAAADAALQAAGFAQQEADKALAEFGKVAEAELKEQSASLDPAVAKQLSDATQLAYQAVQVSGEVAQKTAQLAKEAADAYQASEIAEVLANEQGDLSRARPKLKERLQQRLAVRLPQLQSEAEKLSRQAQAQLVEAYKQGDEAARGAVAEATKTAELEAKKLIDGSSPELKSIITSSPEVEKALIRYAPEVTKALKSVADVVGPTTQAAADSLIASLPKHLARRLHSQRDAVGEGLDIDCAGRVPTILGRRGERVEQLVAALGVG